MSTNCLLNLQLKEMNFFNLTLFNIQETICCTIKINILIFTIALFRDIRKVCALDRIINDPLNEHLYIDY